MPNQKSEPVAETVIPKEPVIETEDLSGIPIIQPEEIAPVIEKKDPIAESPAIAPAMDKKLPHEKRIYSYLESKHTGDFVKLNDFLKSLYPIPKPNERPQWQTQGAMRKLRQDLLAMRDRGEIVFSNNNAERLGDNYHVGEQRIRKDYNIGDLIIEAKLAY